MSEKWNEIDIQIICNEFLSSMRRIYLNNNMRVHATWLNAMKYYMNLFTNLPLVFIGFTGRYFSWKCPIAAGKMLIKSDVISLHYPLLILKSNVYIKIILSIFQIQKIYTNRSILIFVQTNVFFFSGNLFKLGGGVKIQGELF